MATHSSILAWDKGSLVVCRLRGRTVGQYWSDLAAAAAAAAYKVKHEVRKQRFVKTVEGPGNNGIPRARDSRRMLSFAYAAAQVDLFFHLHSGLFCVYLLHLELNSLRLENNGSANGFYIVSGQIPPCAVCNLNSAETHNSTYGPLQLRPVYTFLPSKGSAVSSPEYTIPTMCCSCLPPIHHHHLHFNIQYKLYKKSKGRICLKTFRALQIYLHQQGFFSN